jgi:hypothetical protein
MTATDKRSLISESITATRIDIHLTGEELDRHVVRVAPRVSRTTTVGEVPTKLKSGLYSRDEVLAPSNVWSGRHSGLPHSPSNKLPWSREWQLDKVVTGLLGLLGPKKPTCGQYKSRLAIGAKSTGPKSTKMRAMRQKPQNSHITPHPFLLSAPLNPQLAPPGLAIVTNITSTHHIENILLVHENRGLICEWDLPLNLYWGYQLGIAHLVI